MAVNFVRASSQNFAMPYVAGQVEFGNSDFALSCFITYEAPVAGNFGGLISKWELAGNNLCWTLQKSITNGVTFRITSDGITNITLTSATVLTQDQEVHVFAQRKSDVLELYFDGVQDANTTATTATVFSDVTSGFGIGVGVHVSNTNNFDGQIRDARIYTKSFSIEIIQTIFRANGADKITDNLVGRYLLNEGTTGSAASVCVDISPTGNNGVDTNSPTYQEAATRVI